MTLELRRESDEVYYVTSRFKAIGPDELVFLKERAAENPRLRCRLCLHPNPSDPLNQMVITFRGDTYFRPLRHLERPQSFHVIEGSMRLAFLDETGEVIDAVDLRPAGQGGPYIVRVEPRQWYAFILQDEWFVFHEIISGPMTSGEREFAPFAPEDDDPKAAEYARDLRERASRFSGASR